ncbi:MAG: methyltransferase domain-containing protein [Pseudonocardiaceae bacterium]|nr:methyltransferase domain-containing protein [Pseudonocardiaceae bacterium]
MDYPFADRAAEDERLIAQGRVFDPLTRRVLAEAGLAPGMRVLDLGSGAGNVARLAAERVGEDGSVVGVERDPAAIDLARRRTDAANVEYREGDVRALDGIGDGFDAVIGRLVLMYQPDPVEVLRQAAARLRPGGLLCMHEGDFAYDWACPQTPLWRQIREWVLETLEKAGIEARMAQSLFSSFRAAGLPGPSMLVEAYAAGGSEAPAWGYANVVAGVVPVMEKLGVATEAEVEPATLADRLLAETLAADGCVIGPPLTGAWTTVP